MPIGARRFQPWLERIQEWLHTRSNVRPQRLHAWLQRSDTPDHAVFVLSQTIVTSAAITALLCQDERGWTTNVLYVTFCFPWLYVFCATCCNAKPKLTQSQFYGPPRDTKGRIGVAVQILKNSGAVGLADAIAALYVVFWSAMCMDGLASTWFVAAMYGAYLVQTFGGPFFGMLLRYHLACQRGGDLHSVLRPLVVAEPYVELHVCCSHNEKKGKTNKKVVTHRATEWVPWHAWRDTTHFPREMWLAQRSFLIDVNVVFVLGQGGEAMVADLREQFKMNHSKDVNVCVTSEVCMARFDHTGLWSGLWDGPVSCMAAEPASFRGSLVAKYALASFFVCALPARVWIQAGSARLDVVVQKTLSMNVRERCEGWKVYPPPPLPSGSQGLRGWTFRHPMMGRDGLPRPGEISELPRPTDISAFPRITVLDFVVCWLREQPWVHVSVLLAALWTSVFLAAISSASCVAAWLCCMLVPLVASLEVVLVGFASTEVFMLTVTWCNIVRALVVAVSLWCTISMFAVSKSLVLLWKDRQSPSILTTVRGLTQDKLASEGIVYFADGAVDNSKVTSKRICKQISHKKHGHKKHAKHKCGKYMTYYASPILERVLGMLGAAAFDTTASESYLASAWAVSEQKAPEDVRCARRGGICGIAAEVVFDPSSINSFRHLIDASPVANDTLTGMVFVVDPEAYLAWDLHYAYSVFAVITFVSVILFVVALHTIRRRNTRAERELLLRPDAEFGDTFTDRAALVDAALLSQA